MKNILNYTLILFLVFVFNITLFPVEKVNAATTTCRYLDKFDSLNGVSCSQVVPCQAVSVYAYNHLTGALCVGASATTASTPTYSNSTNSPNTSVLGVLKKGDKDRDLVKALQEALVALGYDLDIDGFFGKDTFSKVLDFQNKSGIARDGVVGKNTFNALIKTLQEKNGELPTRLLSRLITAENEITAFIREANKSIDMNNSATWGVLIKEEVGTKIYRKSFPNALGGKGATFKIHTHD